MPNYRPIARRFARQYGIPEDLFVALINKEQHGDPASTLPWNPSVISPAGAIGFGQLLPGTAQELGVNPYKPLQNLQGSARYLSQQYKRFGSWRQALAAYNAGPGRVESGEWLRIPETRDYVKAILGAAGGGGSLGLEAGPSLSAPSLALNAPAPLPGRSAFQDPLASLALASNSRIAAGQPAMPTDLLSELVTQATQPAEQEARTTGGTVVPPVSPKTGQPPGTARGLAGQVLALAHKQVGQPYVWGGESRSEGGFDCSGLIQWAYSKVGIQIPRTTYEQIKVGRPVAWGHFRPGDLIFANNGRHVVMYVGRGQVIAAPHTGAVVRYQPLNDFRGSFTAARRIITR